MRRLAFHPEQLRFKTELPSSGDYAASNGNTPDVLRAFQSIERGDFASVKDIEDTREYYDRVVVGGGLSGLGAAYEFSKSSRKGRCLILENHAIFGGAAKRNEFIVNGERLIGPQAPNAFGVIDNPETPGYPQRRYGMRQPIITKDSIRSAPHSC